jgi:hypothetical protein
MPELLNIICPDGSRLFASISVERFRRGLRRHLEGISGVEITDVFGDVTQTWIDFRYRGYEFSASDPMGDYDFFVSDAECPEGILQEIVILCGG